MGQSLKWWVPELQLWGTWFFYLPHWTLNMIARQLEKILGDCLLDMCMHCIRSDHQSSEDSWHVFLFVCLAKPYGAEVWANEWFLFFFFFFSALLVLCPLLESGQGKVVSYSDWLAPAVSEKVWCNHREKDTLKRMQCVCDICFYLTHFFPDAGPCSFLAPHNLVLQLPKLMRVGLCCPS